MIKVKNLDVIYQNKHTLLFVIVFLLLIPTSVEAQSMEEIKKQDTVFVLFKKSDRFSKKTHTTGGFFKECTYYSYIYSKSIFDRFIFEQCYMLDFDRKSLVTTVKKRWLKKQLIITEDFLKNKTLEEATAAFSGKRIFVIEARDYKKRKVLIKQARLISSYIGDTNDVIIEYEDIKTNDSIPKH